MAGERLLNRDYYAPEQRFGDTTKVDSRADIYAIGCIFYELLTSIPPVRANAPNLSVLSASLAPFDPVWKRMTEWDPEQRHQSIEQAVEDITFAMGTVLATIRGTAGFRNPDLATMRKLFRSNNVVHHQKATEVALRLGQSALPELHTLLGHSRRDIRNSVARALGRILDASSVPMLVAALYGNSDKPSIFKPGADTAAEALSHYPDNERWRALKLIDRPILPNQALTILRGLDKTSSYDTILELKERGVLTLDYGGTPLSTLVRIDEDRAWPEIKALLSSREDYRMGRLAKLLSTSRRQTIVREWVKNGTEYSWYTGQQIELVAASGFRKSERIKLLGLIEKRLTTVRMKPQDKASLLKELRAAQIESRPRKDLADDSAPDEFDY